MNQASARVGEPRGQYGISRRAAGILLTAGIFAMSFGVARLWSPAVNGILLALGFVSLVSGVILTRKLGPRRLLYVPLLRAIRCPIDATGMKTPGSTSSRSALRTISSSMPEFAKSRSMNAVDVPALGRTSRAVASRFVILLHK